MARLRAAGAIIIAKTNIPEMAMDYDCDNPLFGSTNNPWHTGRVPGGSSGGEAASLASGMCALGLGSDYGGSIRVPAHFCGVVGLKPTWGTIPASGHYPSPASPPPIAHMATIGPMARYVDDLTLEYNLLRGPHPSTPYTVPSSEARPDKVELKKIACAFFTDVCDVPVRPRCALDRARGPSFRRSECRSSRRRRRSKKPRESGWTTRRADGGELLRDMLAGREHLSRERLRRAFMTPQPSKSAAEFFRTAIERDTFRIQLAQFMERYPIVIGPPFCIAAFEHGATEVDIDGNSFNLFAANWPALWVNCAGLPAAVVPAGQDRDGLPIGVQIVGRAFDEETVLAVAKAAETALGGYQRPPM